MLKSKLTRNRLCAVLRYNPKTGIFRWRITKPGHRKAGKIAGSAATKNATVIMIDGTKYYAHRLAWLYMYGVPIPPRLDHKNMDGSDNRIDNLRACTHSENLANRPVPTNNTSGVKGVFWYKKTAKWVARVVVDQKQIHLGYFSSFKKAKSVRQKAFKKFFGEFARHG